MDLDLKNLLDYLVFIVAPLILFFKSIDDFKFRLIAFRSSKLSNFYLKISIILWGIIFISQSINIILKNDLGGYLINFLLILTSIICLFKRNYKLSNSIEEIYEGLLEIVLVFYCFNVISSFFIASIIILTSISAGISKLKSKIWSEDKLGLIMFLTLPSVSRNSIRSLTSKLASKYFFIKNILINSSIFVPWIQILSGLGLLIFPLFNLQIFNNISISLQIIFALLLFVISDLSWITSFYTLLITFFFCSYKYTLYYKNEYFNSQDYLYIALAIVLVILVFKKLFLYKYFNKIKIFNKIIKKFTLGIVPFEMFTEIHMVNIITYYIEGFKVNNMEYFNAFNSLGKRSRFQNLNSRHCQALMYPTGDLIYKCIKSQKKSFFINDNNIYTSDLHKKQCNYFYKLINKNKVNFFQHHFSLDKLDYISNKIASLKINEDNISFKIKNLSNIYPSPRFNK